MTVGRFGRKTGLSVPGVSPGIEALCLQHGSSEGGSSERKHIETEPGKRIATLTCIVLPYGSTCL